LTSRRDRAGRRTVHDTSHEILSAPEVHTAFDRNQDNLYRRNHTCTITRLEDKCLKRRH